MGREVEIPITPGGQISDVAKHDLGSSLHQLVKNLRMKELNVWETIETGADVKTGFTNIKEAIEMSEDASGDRFILYQDGTTLNRLDFDEGDGNGYENETPATLTLPAGVTIGASAVLKFFVFRGVVRISGASVPLWYGYVDRTLFHGDDSFALQGWQLEKAQINLPVGTNDLQLLTVESIEQEDRDAGNPQSLWTMFFKFFYELDEGQFELLKEIDNQTGDPAYYQFDYEVFIQNSVESAATFGNTKGVSLKIRVNGSALKSNMFHGRVTGVAIALAERDIIVNQSVFIEKTAIFKTPESIPISKEIGKLGFVFTSVRWVSGSPTVLIVSDPANSFYPDYRWGFLGASVKVTLSLQRAGIKTLETSVTAVTPGNNSVGSPTRATVTFADSLLSLFATTGNFSDVTCVLTREWFYDASNGYHTYIAVLIGTLGTNFSDFVDFPQATTDNAPNYIHHAVVNERGYAAGMTGDEADSVRFSPISQFDNFPQSFIIQTEAGDADKVLAIVKMDDRLAIIKQKTLNMGNFAGATYRENIGKVLQGMRPTGDQPAFYSLGGLVYIMDVEDVWAFDGLNAISIFKDLLIRKFYQDNLDANSFIFYDKKNDEMNFVLGNSKILCWARERNLFYERNWGTAPAFAYLSETNTLVLALNSGVELVDVNGSGELAIAWGIKTATMGRPHRWHFKLKEIETFLKTTNGNVNIKVTDTNEGVAETVTITAPATLENRVTRPAHHLIKELFVEIESTGETAGNTAEIHESTVRVEVWK